ncbi:hypothetical protein AC477_04900 [miscellaneous Crenarchaeota group-1 archaeon SG8-32-1]|uniref:Uncharacterized protein n=1 Tax=miscellaneous Crenarchaeota group-1 archaeon SG8-32-1 TaxID=1685124 RepID=A0A0M0BPK9_9ARCH|nr:MAG: hypothetical protein AC477_04900 [miscellaneous Crenarchaeota group-1 archaeon SG8-32-1]
MLNHGIWFGERKNLRIYAFLFSIFLLILLIQTVYAFLWSETRVDVKGTFILKRYEIYYKVISVRYRRQLLGFLTA